MQKRFTCPLGHRWEVPTGSSLGLIVDAICCPECGGPAETLPPNAPPIGSNPDPSGRSHVPAGQAAPWDSAAADTAGPIGAGLSPPLEGRVRYFGDYELLA